MENYFGAVQFVSTVFQRALAALYIIAFLVVLEQFPALLGEKGLLPVPEYIRQVPFAQAPSIFHFGYSDRFLTVVAWVGILLAFSVLTGLTEKGPWWGPLTVWLILWALYLSIVNVGQTFYAFGWESMLVEAGFFAAFLGCSRTAAVIIPVLILRWMLFRIEFGAGLIKLRGDQCWRDLTCLFYHYETQPMPNPLSWYFHHFPKYVHSIGVVFSHFVQVIVPFGLFAAQPVAAIAGGLIIFHQMLLIISGNYSWLNWLTVILGLTAFSDAILLRMLPVSLASVTGRYSFNDVLMYVLAAVVLILSIPPAMNFFSRQQLMNFNYNPLCLVNSYGAFGSVTQKRYEIIIEGTQDRSVTPQTRWVAYEFKAKPGDVRRMPPQFAPYHLRLDWLMWFLPFSVDVHEDGIAMYGYERWFLRFVEKLLQADPPTLKLLAGDPFQGQKPRFVRARYYLYQFTDADERKKTGAWWKRRFIDEYLPPVTLKDLRSI
jgi:hypothetical protein